MIKELITTALLVSAPLNTTIASIKSNNQYNNKNNIQDVYTYDQDDLLAEHKQLYTINFRSASFGSNFSIDARSICYITEDKTMDNYDYKQLILLKHNNLDNLNITTIDYSIYVNATNIWATLNNKPDYVQIYYLNSLTTAQVDFLEGQNYNSFQEIETIYNSIKNNMLLLNDMTGTYPNYNYQTNKDYVVIEINLNYIDNLIGYNGAFMFTMNPPIMTVNEELWYEVPEIAGYEVIDLPGLMFTILGMPFAWLSTAFNFTIFPNTQYAVNLSHILMAIVISLIVLYIVKKIIK